MIETSEVVSITLGGQEVFQIADLNGTILWEADYANSYFAIRNPGSSAITLTLNRYEDEAPSTFNVEKQGDGDSDFVVWGSTASTLSMSIPAGKSVKFRALNNSWKGLHFDSTGNIELSGNIMSLVAGSDYRNAKSLASYTDGAFPGLFSAPDDYWGSDYSGFTPHFNVSSIDRLTLPANTLGGGDYYRMFRNCTKIRRIPKKFIRAISGIAKNSCYGMFYGCTGLTTIENDAISTPAYIGEGGCEHMFNGCTSLATIPNDLCSAPIVGDYGYAYMFRGCNYLTTLPINFLPATTLGKRCYSNMFASCSKLRNTPALPATTLAEGCYGSMFLYCTSLTTAPALAANIIPSHAYNSMFEGCTYITQPPIMSARIVERSGMRSMFETCIRLTIPSGYELLITNVGPSGFESMFQSCTSITTVPETMLQNLENVGSSGCDSMFYGCTSLTQVQLRNDPTLTGTYNFQEMFKNCSSLNYISCDHMASLANTTSEGAYANWVNGVAASGSFYQIDGANWNRGVNGVPTNWSLSVSDPMTLIPLRVANNNDEEITLTIGPRVYSCGNVSTNITVAKAVPTNEDISLASKTYSANYRVKDGSWEHKYWGPTSHGQGSSGYNDYNITIPAHSYVEFSDCTLGGEELGGYGKIMAINLMCPSEVDILGNINKTINLTDPSTITSNDWGKYACSLLFEGLTITTLRKIRLPLNLTTSDLDTGTTSQTAQPGLCMYKGLFANCTFTYPNSIPNNFLPSSAVPYGAYAFMFCGSNITSVPKKIFRNGRYVSGYHYGPGPVKGRFGYMFANCTDLEEVGDIFSNVVLYYAFYDFAYTFANCTSLSDMSGLSLKRIYTQNGAFYGMFAGSGITKSPKLYDSAFNYSYAYMFQDCSNLNEIWAYFDPTQGWNGGPVYLTDWVKGVASSGTFHYKTGESWTTGDDGIPTGWSSVAENIEENQPLYLSSSSANTYSINLVKGSTQDTVPVFNVYYSEDGTIWNNLGSTEDLDSETPFTFSGTKLYLKASTTRWSSNSATGDYIQINATNNFSVGGNIGSILLGDDWESATAIDVAPRAFTNLFAGSRVNSIYSLKLDYIKSVGESSFENTFRGCTSLTSLPKVLLPDTLEVSGDYCFSQMFGGCTGLTGISGTITPKKIIYTGNTYSSGVFVACFYNCTNIETINNNALRLEEIDGDVRFGYSSMFQGCSKLKAESVHYLNLPLDPVPQHFYNKMFEGCTLLTYSPELRAKQVENYGYKEMFSGCTALNKVYILAEELDTNSLHNWLNNVAGSGTVYYKDGTSSLYPTNSTSGIPTGWTGSVYTANFSTTFVNKGSSDIKLNFTVSRDSSSSSYSYYPFSYYDYSTMSGGTVSYNTITTYTIPSGHTVRLSLYSDWSISAASLNNPSDGNYLSIKGRWFIPNDLRLLKGDNFGNTDITDLYVPGGDTMNFSYLFANTQRAIPDWFYDKLKENQPKNITYCFGQYQHGYQFEDGILPAKLLNAIENMQGTITGGRVFYYSNIFSISDLSIFKKLEGLSGIFSSCSNLLSVGGSITVDTSKTYNYSAWFSNCTSLRSVSIDLLPSTTLSSSCYSSMFSGCTSLTQGPDLPAPEMAEYCYSQMFSGCTSLNILRIWATNSGNQTNYNNILYNNTQSGTLYKKSGTTWSRGTNAIPDSWILANLPKESYETYFYLENTGNTDATIGLNHSNAGMMWEPFTGGTISYSTDESTWTSWGSWSATVDEGTMETTWTKNGAYDLTLASGSRLYFKCSGEMFARSMMPGEESAGQYFTMTGSTLKAGGNIWSMRLGDNFTSQTELAWNLGPIFKNCTALNNVDELCIANPGSSVGGYAFDSLLSYTGITSIPAGFFDNIVGWGSDTAGTAEYSFNSMFQSCSSLTTINGTYLFKTPTNIQDYSTYTCNSMFQGCSSLTTVPGKLFSTTASLPADSSHGITYTFCYMFCNCTSLTTSPDINVVCSGTLDQDYTSVFSNMFYGCTNLNSVRMSVSNTSWAYNNSTTGAFGGWLERVASSGTLYTTSDSIWATSSTSGIPSGWTRVNS